MLGVKISCHPLKFPVGSHLGTLGGQDVTFIILDAASVGLTLTRVDLTGIFDNQEYLGFGGQTWS